jgi:ketosteroid isomerase-like protein
MLRKCAGPGELRKLFAWVEESFEPFNLKASEYWTIAPNGLLVKYATDAVYLKNGRPYQNAYLGVFWFDEDGKIAEWYEYCNPITVLYAFGR